MENQECNWKLRHHHLFRELNGIQCFTHCKLIRRVSDLCKTKLLKIGTSSDLFAMAMGSEGLSLPNIWLLKEGSL